MHVHTDIQIVSLLSFPACLTLKVEKEKQWSHTVKSISLYLQVTVLLIRDYTQENQVSHYSRAVPQSQDLHESHYSRQHLASPWVLRVRGVPAETTTQAELTVYQQTLAPQPPIHPDRLMYLREYRCFQGTQVRQLFPVKQRRYNKTVFTEIVI